MDRNENGGTDGIRTRDHCIKSAMLYRLSYRPLELSRPMAEAWEEGPCPCPPPGGNPLPLSRHSLRRKNALKPRVSLANAAGAEICPIYPLRRIFPPVRPSSLGNFPFGREEKSEVAVACRRVGAVRGFEASTLFPGPPPGRRGRTPASPRGRCRPVYPGGVPGPRGRVPIGRIRGGVPRRRRGGRRY